MPRSMVIHCFSTNGLFPIHPLLASAKRHTLLSFNRLAGVNFSPMNLSSVVAEELREGEIEKFNETAWDEIYQTLVNKLSCSKQVGTAQVTSQINHNA